ncbi:MAG TPA: hypothetical protein DCX32_04985 [Candidatus Moranbacteria bacterium]|nr:MAG: polymerase III, delta prime subunit, DNA polymerase III subunit delta' protein [Parcubacteria group bacterium GW2011_GWC1_45_14]HAV11862.1 hypothetical protein [Candidatus Moranbacteria bacterium]
MNFVGNKKAVSFIEKTLERGATSQAYLFSGPESVGKFFLAQAFAKSLINEGSLRFEDSGAGGLVVDLVVIKPEIEERKGVIKERDITIERVREARKDLALFPHSGKRKVLIVDNAHKMNITSQNAFLKILEEPNSTSVIILVTHEDSKILPTIKSRCQKVNFGLVGREMEMEMGSLVGEDFAGKYGALAMGRPGLLFEMAREKERLEYHVGSYEQFRKVFSMDLNQRLSFAEKMSKDVNAAIGTLNVWNWILRKEGLEDGGRELGETYLKISAIEDSMATLKSTNANPRLVLENLLISI